MIEIASEMDLRFEGAHVFRGVPIPRWALTRRDGILTTQPIWTILDLCRVATLEQVECAIDYCIRVKWTSFPNLQKAADHYGARRRPGVSVLRRILELRGLQWQHTDSILETMCLQLLRAAHLPKPVLQYAIVHNGREVAHADLAYPERRVLIETLGLKAHREKRWQLTRDCVRENAIELLRGYTVLKFTSDQVIHQPEVVVGDVCEALGIPVQKRLRLLWRTNSAA